VIQVVRTRRALSEVQIALEEVPRRPPLIVLATSRAAVQAAWSVSRWPPPAGSPAWW
jgi:hypothetical protein